MRSRDQKCDCAIIIKTTFFCRKHAMKNIFCHQIHYFFTIKQVLGSNKTCTKEWDGKMKVSQNICPFCQPTFSDIPECKFKNLMISRQPLKILTRGLLYLKD